MIARRMDIAGVDDLFHLLKQSYPVSGQCPVDESHRLYGRGGYFECRACKKYYSYYEGTVFAAGRLDFRVRLDMLWQLAQAAVTNKQAQREWGVNPNTYQRFQYGIFRTCQSWMNQQELQGEIEVDEAFLGTGVGRSALPAVFIAIEKDARGRVQVQRSEQFTKNACHAFITSIDTDAVSMIHTDGWKGYNDIYKRVQHSTYTELPQVHSAINQLKTYLKTYVRPVKEDYLSLYLAHWAWLYSHRHLTPAERFDALLNEGMRGRVLP